MACACAETRISYADKRGNGRVAPVSYRCAEHRPALRANDAKRHAAGLAFLAAVARVCRPALPAPRLLLTVSA